MSSPKIKASHDAQGDFASAHPSTLSSDPQPHRPRTRASRPKTSPNGRLLRRREVQRLTGLSRSSIYRMIAADEFPRPIQLSAKCVAWLEFEVDNWISYRIAESRSTSRVSAQGADVR